MANRLEAISKIVDNQIAFAQKCSPEALVKGRELILGMQKSSRMMDPDWIFVQEIPWRLAVVESELIAKALSIESRKKADGVVEAVHPELTDADREAANEAPLEPLVGVDLRKHLTEIAGGLLSQTVLRRLRRDDARRRELAVAV